MMNKITGMVHSARRARFGALGVLLLLGALGVLPGGAAQTNASGTASAAEAVPAITVYKTKMCGCCTKWVEHLEHSGLDVNVILVDETSSMRTRLGIPPDLASCHTAVAGDYWVEGHVPADLIQQLLQERPSDIQGIAAPGMSPGSPGMESTEPVTYHVFSVDDSGEVGIYATRQGGDAN
jgi:hypothetical protein